MITTYKKISPLQKQKGVSLTELMIAITINLIVMAGATSILVNANKVNRIQDDLLELQENARFAIEQITRDLQITSYFGCTKDNNLVDGKEKIVNNISNLTSSNQYAVTPIFGGDAQTGETGDTLSIQFASRATTLVGDMANLDSTITVDDASSFTVGQPVLIANCDSGDVFAISDINSNTLSHAEGIVPSTGFENATGALSALYVEDNFVQSTTTSNNGSPITTIQSKKTEVLKLNSIRYSIFTPTDVSGVSGIPELQRNGNTFLQGVDMFEVLYGVDLNGDQVPNQFLNAADLTSSSATWANVIAVRFALLLRTVSSPSSSNLQGEYGQAADATRYPDSGPDAGLNVLDVKFLNDNLNVRRRLFESTAYLRNNS